VLITIPGECAGGVVTALELGADDCMRHPLDGAELVARLRALARRAGGHCKPVISAGVLMLDTGLRSVMVDGREIRLTRREYEMIELLMLRKGQTVPRSTLIDHMYGADPAWVPDLKIFDVMVCKLRKKLGARPGEPHRIEVVWGQGFRIGAANGRAPV
jgi:two-component system cell cycle response regulator CtrA